MKVPNEMEKKEKETCEGVFFFSWFLFRQQQGKASTKEEKGNEEESIEERQGGKDHHSEQMVQRAGLERQRIWFLGKTARTLWYMSFFPTSKVSYSPRSKEASPL